MHAHMHAYLFGSAVFSTKHSAVLACLYKCYLSFLFFSSVLKENCWAQLWWNHREKRWFRYMKPSTHAGKITIVTQKGSANLPADTRCEVRDADGKTGWDSLGFRLPGSELEKISHNPGASLFSMEAQFPIIFCQGSISFQSIFHFLVRASTFVYPYENEFLKLIASVLHSACCSLGEGVINGRSHSVCSRQALLLLLPPWATRTLLTPSQEQANIWLHPASGI